MFENWRVVDSATVGLFFGLFVVAMNEKMGSKEPGMSVLQVHSYVHYIVNYVTIDNNDCENDDGGQLAMIRRLQ